MKRFLVWTLCLAMLAAALTPVALRQYRLWRDDRLAAAYLDAAASLDPAALERSLEEAGAYNRALGDAGVPDPFAPGAGGSAGLSCAALPDPTGGGVLAVLEIPKLGESLPVFHGADAGSMALGAGHLEGTALPMAGSTATCALAAQRGTLGSGPFARLDRLIPGDRFAVRGPRDVQDYEVVRTVEATGSDLADWRAEEAGACLLMTTARGSQDRRLLVVGRRVNPGESVPGDGTRALPLWAAGLGLAAPLAAAGLALLGLVEGLRRVVRRRRLKRAPL